MVESVLSSRTAVPHDPAMPADNADDDSEMLLGAMQCHHLMPEYPRVISFEQTDNPLDAFTENTVIDVLEGRCPHQQNT